MLNRSTFAGVICVSGEKRIPPGSWPYVGHSVDASGFPFCPAIGAESKTNVSGQPTNAARSNLDVLIDPQRLDCYFKGAADCTGPSMIHGPLNARKFGSGPRFVYRFRMAGGWTSPVLSPALVRDAATSRARRHSP